MEPVILHSCADSASSNASWPSLELYTRSQSLFLLYVFTLIRVPFSPDRLTQKSSGNSCKFTAEQMLQALNGSADQIKRTRISSHEEDTGER